MRYSRVLDKFRYGLISSLLLWAVFLMNHAFAADLILRPLADGYTNCSYVDNGNGTSTVTVTISWRGLTGNIGSNTFYSRGVLLYSYDANGKLRPSSNLAASVTLDGVRNAGSYTGRLQELSATRLLN